MVNNQQDKEIKWEPKTFADIWLAIALCRIEISGLAKVRKEGSVFIVYDDVIIPKQICSETNTEFDGKAYDQWCRETIEVGNGVTLNEYRLWWHSHVFSQVQASPTDEENISRWKHCDWWLSFIGNKKGNWMVRLDVFQPVRLYPRYDLSQSLTEPIGKEQFRKLMCDREQRIQKLVTRQVHEEFDNTKRFERILRGVFGND